jgi:hypothetical protein
MGNNEGNGSFANHMLDQLVEERGGEAVAVVAKQFGLTDDELVAMMNDNDGNFDEHPAYEAYFALLDRWYQELMGA